MGRKFMYVIGAVVPIFSFAAIIGTPTQSLASDVAPINRPQVAAISAKKAVYLGEDIRFENKAAGVSLAGTFSTPIGRGPFPTVILLAGSGPNNRDEEPEGPNQTPNGHKKFLVMADALNRAGIAVLRYDKRGVGKSTGDFSSATLTDFANDAEAALHYLQTRPDVSQDSIGVIGDSEGGYIAPMLVTRTTKLRYMVLLSTAALPAMEVNLLQKATIARAEGKSETEIAADHALYQQIFAVVITSENADVTRARLTAMSAPVIASGRFTVAEAEAGITGLTSPYGFDLMKYDPQPYLEKVTIPVLVISGALDTQAPPKENLPAMKANLKMATDVTTLELPGLNHNLQTARTGAPSEYAEIEQTIAPSALSSICDWIVSRTR